MSDKYLFTFAAKGLQSYIMRGGKLRDMVGATSLIDKLSDERHLKEWLDGPFDVAGRYEILQAAAGGARIQFNDKNAADKVSRLWPLWCHAWAPDLDVVQDLQPWDDKTSYGKVSKAAGEQLERNRNFPAALMPEAGPFVKRAPRTGEAAVAVDHAAEKELIDRASQRKRAERDEIKNASDLPPVAKAFGFTDANRLPEDFTQISGPSKAYLAVIHADGNGLGQMFLNVGRALDGCGPEHDETATALFKYLSQEVVAEGTRAAVRAAVGSLPTKAKPDGKPWLFAPIVLAGDDVTVVCRADLGLLFAETFLKAFEQEMQSRFTVLRENRFPTDKNNPDRYRLYEGLWEKLSKLPDVTNAIPRSLSAGAGVVFCTDHYPFSLAYELCESLAKQAKNTAKAKAGEGNTPPSALSFVRITGASAPTEFDDLAGGILKGADGTLLTGGPYFVDGGHAPQFADLREVFDAACPPVKSDDADRQRRLVLPGTSLRGLLNLQRTEIGRVPEAVERMKEVATGRGGKSAEAWKQFEKAWKDLCGWNAPPPQEGGSAQPQRDWKDLTFFDARTKDGKFISPLYDLLTLIAVRDKAKGDEDEDRRADTSTQAQS